MRTLFILPLALSVVGSLYFAFATEADRKWKALALGLAATGLILQFGFRDELHFLVPLLFQLGVSIWMAIYWKLDG